MVRAFGLYLGGITFESFSTHHCWSLSKSFIPSLVVWSMTQNNAFDGEKQTKKSNGGQSDICDLEQVTLKPQLQAQHCLTTWLRWVATCGNGEIYSSLRRRAKSPPYEFFGTMRLFSAESTTLWSIDDHF